MRSVVGLALALVVSAVGCDGGLGRAVVGTRPVDDGGRSSMCAVTPACVPPETPSPAAFAIPPERLEPPRFDDCDADGTPDVEDPCPGVAASEGGCDAARHACDRLQAGEGDLAGADLRGCRPADPVEVSAQLSLAGVDLSCASVRLRSSRALASTSLDLIGARVRRSALSFESPGAWVIELDGIEVRESFLRASGGARLHVEDGTLSDARVVLAPSGSGPGDASPALSLVGGTVDGTSVAEQSGPWPGGVRIDGATLSASTLSVMNLELSSATVMDSALDASSLIAVDADVSRSAIRAPYALLSGSTLGSVVFAQCADLSIVDSALEDVDVPACGPDRFRLSGSIVTDSRLGGGVVMMDGKLSVSVVGGVPGTSLHTERAELEAVTLCDLEAGVFRGGALRCIRCAPETFMDGMNVCIDGAALARRGCPPLEFAPSCP